MIKLDIGHLNKADRFQEGEVTRLPFGILTRITYLPFCLSWDF